VSTAKDLRDGVRDALIAAGVATTAQIFKSKMPATPDKVLVVTWYPVAAGNTEGVQVRVRGEARSNVSAEDWAGDVLAALHGIHDRVWGGTQLALLAYQSGARMGFDGSDRDEVVLNFYATTSAPSTSLVDVI
jgi:hypothetical protein